MMRAGQGIRWLPVMMIIGMTTNDAGEAMIGA
jgi:hypothetical protein